MIFKVPEKCLHLLITLLIFNMNHILYYASAMSIAMSALSSCSSKQSVKIEYPTAPTEDVTDDYFGIKVADPYRPLENDTSAATLEWVNAERKVTEDYLSAIPFRNQIRERITELNNYRKTGRPSKHKDGYYYYYDNDGLKNQSVLYRKKGLDGTPEIFLDPNSLSEDGTVALTGVFFDNKQKYTAYTISRNGSDWTEIYVMDTKTRELLPDHIEWAKFTGASWHGDGFYYSAYDRPADGKEFSNANEFQRIYYHKLGTPQSEDKLIYEDKDHPLYFHHVWVPEDESVMILTVSGNGNGNAMKIKDLRKPNAKWITVEPTQEQNIGVVDVINDTLYILTSYDAPRYKLVTASVDKPERQNWKELVPEQEGVLESAQMAGDKMILTYNQDAANRAYIYDLAGNKIKEIEFPTYGQVGFSSDKGDNEAFFTFTSFLFPASVYSLDLESGDYTLYNTPEVNGFKADDYVTEQVFYPSADGTQIPMFLTYRKGMKRNGKNPIYLYGYGGFNISLNPGFSANRLLWLENGGIYAQTNLRGGGEYGEEWHEAGTKMQKLNVFNDFIAAAEYLIKEKWTSPEYIVAEGGSNGGLLVGATVNMRPDLFRVAIPRVGVMDMLRYHLFTIGWNWAHDYGTSADSQEMAQYLRDYSPLHNISNDGTPYPAIMVTTADHDDRVVPAHSFKYAAELQKADTGGAPKIIRIDSNAGHGGGKPITKIIDEYTDIYSFIFENLGMEPAKK